MLLQNLIPLLPSEVIMPLAGFLASMGYLDLRGAILAGLLGSLAGHLPWYGVGRAAGQERLRSFASRHGRWVGLGESHVRRADRWFQRNAVAAVLLGRLLPGIRTVVNVPAGATRMPFLPFLGYTAVGDAVWTGSLAWGGYVLGREYHMLSWYLHLLLVPAALLGAAVIWSHFRRPRGPTAPTGSGLGLPGIPKGA